MKWKILSHQSLRKSIKIITTKRKECKKILTPLYSQMIRRGLAYYRLCHNSGSANKRGHLNWTRRQSLAAPRLKSSLSLSSPMNTSRLPGLVSSSYRNMGISSALLVLHIHLRIQSSSLLEDTRNLQGWSETSSRFRPILWVLLRLPRTVFSLDWRGSCGILCGQLYSPPDMMPMCN